MIIAIDGPAAAGKGILAKRLAEHFGLALMDTGLIYRAVGMNVVRAGGDPEDTVAATAVAEKISAADLDVGDLRSDTAADAASKVSVVPGVRAALLAFQREFAANPSGGAAGAVLDGRDIGTVVCPDADVKLFISATVEVRAKRRVKELQERGLEAIYARVLEDMKERDARDQARAVSPLEPAKNAYPLDTSDLDADQVFERVLEYISSRNQEV